VSGESKPGWRVVRGTVDTAKALAEYERVKAMLPPGVEPTLDDLHRVNARDDDGVHRRARGALDVPPEAWKPLSRSDVLKARRRWQRGEGNPWTLAIVSEATYLRARHRHGLVPWPADYLHKMKG
jgi:hypothetical protein